MILTGMPYLNTVAVIGGVGSVEALEVRPRRPTGREEDTIGLSVRMLCINALRLALVLTPVKEDEDWSAEAATSLAVATSADDDGGNISMHLLMHSSVFRRYIAVEAGS
jgi:hypothetical protein